MRGWKNTIYRFLRPKEDKELIIGFLFLCKNLNEREKVMINLITMQIYIGNDKERGGR